VLSDILNPFSLAVDQPTVFEAFYVLFRRDDCHLWISFLAVECPPDTILAPLAQPLSETGDDQIGRGHGAP
jgi:hypothetical protein